jgi:hypothetical protein
MARSAPLKTRCSSDPRPSSAGSTTSGCKNAKSGIFENMTVSTSCRRERHSFARQRDVIRLVLLLSSLSSIVACASHHECTLDSDCHNVHSACVGMACECAAGYSSGPSGSCEWSGVVADPGFQSGKGWSLDPDIRIEDLDGCSDRGAVRFGGTGLCKVEHVRQDVLMPRYSGAQPLVLSITYTYGQTDSGWVAPAFAIGPTWREDLESNRTGQCYDYSIGGGTEWFSTRVCLGATMYAPETSTGRGALLALDVRPTHSGSPLCARTHFDVDHVEITPAEPGECPAPGTALNGDVEGSGGWIFGVYPTDKTQSRSRKSRTASAKAGHVVSGFTRAASAPVWMRRFASQSQAAACRLRPSPFTSRAPLEPLRAH